MCLSVRQGVPEKTGGFGWKIFRQDKKGDTLFSVVFDCHQRRPRRTWLQSSYMRSWRTSKAEAGFHIYLDRQDAVIAKTEGFSRKVLRKVRYRGAFLQGVGNGSLNERARVVVAKEIYIIEANRA